jgi:hypothetical protein
VPADYDRIRAENITRYGTDTAVLDLLGQLYSDRAHFIFELIQNAEDAGATRLSFELFADRLVVRHDGRPFTEADVRGICGVAKSTKSGDLTAIGTFGIGFKAVYAYTQTPSVHSHDEHFRIENYVRPVAITAAGDGPDVAGPGETLFVFPFDREDAPPAAAVAEISAALAGLDPATLLFLRHIERLTVSGGGIRAALLERQVSDTVAAVAGTGVPARRQVRLRRSSAGATSDSTTSDSDSATSGSGTSATQDWLVWHRDLAWPGQRAEIAFRVQPGIDGPQLTAAAAAPLVVFFPTQKETFLGFWVQGPYRTTPARDNVPEHDPANQALARETAVLLAGVLADVRDEGWLTAAVLQALPLEEDRFGPGSLLRPLFDAVAGALATEDFIPAAGGGYRRAGELALAQDAGLRDLLSAGQLSTLPGMAGPREFASGSISPDGTPALWRCLRAGTAIAEITPESFAGSLSGEWLAAQPDDWIRRLYAWLYLHLPLWSAPEGPGGVPGVARAKPIIRLQDGSQVLPFDAAGRPAVYLPGPAELAEPTSSPDPASPTEPISPAEPGSAPGSARSAESPSPAHPGPAQPGLPTVRLAIARHPDARRFLDALQLGEPDLVAEVLDAILPRYTGLDVADLDAAQHQSDLERVAVALGTATPAERDQLTAQLRETPFLTGENAATGELALMPPDRLYLRTPDLESYFGGNPDCWFARDTYGPWYPQLREMGAREAVTVHAKPPGADGHVAIAVDFARHERGLNGFDPDAAIDGLEFALGHPSHRRSEYTWNELLVPHRDLLAGTVERSVRLGFADASREEIRSAIGTAAAAAAWLPGLDGTFCLPADLELDDLPPVFRRDDALALALGMIQPVVAQAARQLGLPPAVLRGLAAHPDLVAMVERELKARPGGTSPGRTSPGGTSSHGTSTPDQSADPTDGLLAGWLRDD